MQNAIEGYAIGACLCLGTMLDFLRFMNVDPRRSKLALPLTS
jgi:hypothetical protein